MDEADSAKPFNDFAKGLSHWTPGAHLLKKQRRIPADPSQCCQGVRQREEEAKEERKVVTGGLGPMCPVSAPADTQSPAVGEGTRDREHMFSG